MPDVLRVGNGAGFWGDNLDAPVRLASSAACDVLTLEYLAELTMAILAHLRAKDPKRSGFVTDFPPLVERLSPVLRDSSGFTVVTNAGGLNPTGCAQAIAPLLEAAGLGSILVAVVTGDDILTPLPRWIEDGYRFEHLETGEPLQSVKDRLVAANCYLGAPLIARALQSGARIVITGRVADASLTVGPAAAAFHWDWDKYDVLAGATTAGHIIECGAQATGGLWHEYESLPDLANVGYPVAQIEADGSAVITKPEGSGGQVTVGTIAEQLVYEIDDPTRYRTPDVDVDFTTVNLREVGPNRVRVHGARGVAPSSQLKASCVYRDGWTASGLLAVVGPDAAAKARFCGQLILGRVKSAGFVLEDSLIECLGAGDIVPGVLSPRSAPWEVVLRVTARDPRRNAVDRFCREFAPLVTSGPPGIAGYASGRPEVRPAFGYFPTLVPRNLLEPQVEILPAREWSDSNDAKSPEPHSA